MKLLVLGGGGFLGYHVVDQAVQAGHDVTVFSRGNSAPRDGVRVLVGDRQKDLNALGVGKWDGVVDTFTDSAPGAPAVRRTAELLSGRVGAYAYVSGMSVYAPNGPSVPNETAPLRAAGREPAADPLQERSLAKLAGEAAVSASFDGPALFPRVGIMVGPRDPSQRFTWWPVRLLQAISDGGFVPAPGSPDRPVQFSDARDIAGWIVAAVAERRAGAFNTVGPGRREAIADVLEACAAAARSVRGAPTHPQLRWLTDEHDLRARLRAVPEEDRPLWFPEDQIPQQAIDSSAALVAGLSFRSTYDTALDTLRWALAQGEHPLSAGAFRERLLPDGGGVRSDGG